MDIMELGAIGELVGGVAVVASLLYVGLQVRQSNQIEKAESIRSITGNYITTILQVDAPLFRKAMTDFGNLPGDEQMKIHNYLVAMFLIAQTEVSLSERGLGDVGDYPPVIASLTHAPGIQEWWAVVGPTFDTSFRDYIARSRELKGQPPIHERFPWFISEQLQQGSV